MAKSRKKNRRRLTIKKSVRPIIGTQYIRQGHLNKVVRGSGFLTKAIKYGKKILKSSTAKKFISTARKELKKKKNQKIILNAANKVLNKLDGKDNLVKKRRKKGLKR